MGSAGEQAESAAAVRVRQVVELAGFLVLAAPLLGALLLYLGFVRTQVVCDYFGIEVSLLGFSVQDFGLRSARVLTDPLPVLAVAVLGLLAAHVLATRLLRRLPPHSRWHRASALGSAGAGVLLLAAAFDGLGRLPGGPHVVTSQMWAAVTLGAGAVLLEYAAYLVDQHRLRRWRQRRHTRRRRTRPAPLMPPRLALLRRAALGSLLAAALLWGLTVQAAREGARVAYEIALAVPERAEVAVYTRERLQLPQYGGMAVQALPGQDGWRFRYTGLHVLFYSNSRWFLLPAGWRADNGSSVIILTDDPASLRVEMRP